MKKIFVIIQLLLLFESTYGFTNCPLKFFKADPVNWEQIGEGYLLGIRNDTTTRSQCAVCRDYGNDVKGINEGIVYIE